MIFLDRIDAGKQLAKKLEKYKDQKNAIILAIPRGGVVIGYELSKALNIPLDIIVTKKIGAPGNPEFAVGSVNMGGEVMLDEQTLNVYNIDKKYVESEVEKIRSEIKNKLERLRGNTELPDFGGKTIILTDDGIATGYTIKAAISFIKKKIPKKLIVAIPVSPPETVKELEKEVDEIVCLHTPLFLGAVGAFYQNFGQTSDEEVRRYLRDSKN